MPAEPAPPTAAPPTVTRPPASAADSSLPATAPAVASPAAAGPMTAAIADWLAALGLAAEAHDEREGAAAWDLFLDGRRRRDLRVTLILAPDLGLVAWAQFAPPLGDAFRKSYRRLLRWNDEFPFAKFGLTEDERPVLSIELPPERLTADELGLALARLAGIGDRLLDEAAGWLWIGGRMPDGYLERAGRNDDLLDRFAARLPELLGP